MSLRRRGLAGVRLVISDQHAGLVAALRRCLQGAAHQRCRVHFVRNLLSLVGKANQEMVAAMFRTVFAQPSAEEVSAQYDKVTDMLSERFAKAAQLMSDATEELISFSAFPKAHWRQLWSTNPIVIWSQPEAVWDVADEGSERLGLGAGRGYLPRSSTQVPGRFGVRSKGGGARLAA